MGQAGKGFKRLAVTGHPVLQSRSPDFFRALFSRFNINAHYSRIAAGSAREAVDLFRDLNLQGMNVTMPFKHSILEFLDEIDPVAADIAAVNTVVNRGGRLAGYNTDHLGVVHALLNRQVKIEGRKCLVIGAGGAGSAAVYGLVKERGMVTVVNRDFSRASALARKFNCDCQRMKNLSPLLGSADIVVSTVPSRTRVCQPEKMKAGGVFFPADYTNSLPRRDFLKRGVQTIDGLDWLMHQGVASFSLFFPEYGKKPAIRPWRQRNLSTRNISLIGFMGSGKTTIGRMLAGRLHYSYQDTDLLIEESEGVSIPRIFKERGEKYFRGREAQILDTLIKKSRQLLSLGGGIIMDKQNTAGISAHSLVVWLHASLETCLARIDKASRPLLNLPGGGREAETIFKERMDQYFKAADLIIYNETSDAQAAGRIDEEIGQII